MVLFNVAVLSQEYALCCFILGFIRDTSNARPTFPQNSTSPYSMLGPIYYTNQITLNSVKATLHKRSPV